MQKIDITNFMINELANINTEETVKLKLYMEFNKNLCNDVLYNDPKYKESTVILTNIFRTLMADFCKEVHDYINEEGVYKHE